MRAMRCLADRRVKLILAAVGTYIVISTFVSYGSVENSRSGKWKKYLSLSNVAQVFSQSNNEAVRDFHLSDNLLDYTGEDSGLNGPVKKFNTTVAIGLGITGKGVKDTSHANISSSFQFFHIFLPTFCDTASTGFHYPFYLAYDATDSTFNNETFLIAFAETFQKMISKKCPADLTASIHFVQCDHAGKPVWAQNDAMLEAYLDNVDYHYRINDDSHMISKNWTNAFIEVLNRYSPTRVGVVGPNHSGGNVGILTYDFVHRTHIDILGFYYPRTITDWWGDDWMTTVYRPKRMTKLPNIGLRHTMTMGRRYGVNWNVGQTWRSQMDKDKIVIERYIQYLETKGSQNRSATWGRNVISMSLYGKDPKYTWGAIRNAQLAPIFFPDWKLRFYVVDPEVSDSVLKTNFTVPPRILRKIQQLGAEVKTVPESIANTLPARFWRYLVIDDQDVDYFLIRDANSRLSDRENSLVEEWLNKTKNSTNEKAMLHCIRDHPSHVNRSVVEGLWGGDARKVRSSLPSKTPTISESIQDFLKALEVLDNLAHTNVISTVNTSVHINSFAEAFWQKLNLVSLCHDSVSCKTWPRSVPIGVPRPKDIYIGQKYDEHHEKIPTPSFTDNLACASQTTTTIKPTTLKPTVVPTTVKPTVVATTLNPNLTTIKPNVTVAQTASLTTAAKKT